MQHPPPEIRQFSFAGTGLRLLMPARDTVQAGFRNTQGAPAPYWARLWPSAIALCRHLAAHPGLVAGKTVLELAAGLGLPGILAAHWAEEVTLSDYAPEAVAMIEESARLNGLSNIYCSVLDWNALPEELNADVLLLSDINYAPESFEVLYKVLTGFLAKGATIILATPQRLMAKPFIERLLPVCRAQSEQEVLLDGERAFISILELRAL